MQEKQAVRQYLVEGDNGGSYIRNRLHIQELKALDQDEIVDINPTEDAVPVDDDDTEGEAPAVQEQRPARIRRQPAHFRDYVPH